MNQQNITQLRKQAKNLVRLYPALVSNHPSCISLAVAQSLIASLNGYPNWESLVGTRQPSRQKAPSDAIDLSNHLYFELDSKAIRLPVAYSEETGNPTRFRKGFDATLRYRNEEYRHVALEEDDRLDAIFEQAFGTTFDTSYTNLEPEVRFYLLDVLRKSLKICPFCIETYGRMAGLWYAERQYTQAVDLIEPLVMQLTAMIPSHDYVQVSYASLANRPFHRLVHNYVLSLDKVGRHREADQWAKKMIKLCPNDNIGFRYLSSRTQRSPGAE